MRSTSSLLAAALAWTLSGMVLAQDGEETIVLLPEKATLPEVVTAAIVLPTDDNGNYRASERGVERSAQGLAIANAAREDGRAFGEQMAAAAKDNRESHARHELPAPRDRVPDHVSPPTPPERPETPASPPATP
jgi:hypothetical protein